MASAPTTVPPRRLVDENGRALPMTEAEIRRQAEAGISTLMALRDMGDEDEQRATLDALMTALDEDRMSDRPRFRSCD